MSDPSNLESAWDEYASCVEHAEPSCYAAYDYGQIYSAFKAGWNACQLAAIRAKKDGFNDGRGEPLTFPTDWAANPHDKPDSAMKENQQ